MWFSYVLIWYVVVGARIDLYHISLGNENSVILVSRIPVFSQEEILHLTFVKIIKLPRMSSSHRLIF